jgi:hypothetical protein
LLAVRRCYRYSRHGLELLTERRGLNSGEASPGNLSEPMMAVTGR